MPVNYNLTNEEEEIVNLIGEVWNKFLKLPKEHPSEQFEFRHDIHHLQHRIMARPIRRQLNKIVIKECKDERLSEEK